MVFKKLTRASFFKIAFETMLLPILINFKRQILCMTSKLNCVVRSNPAGEFNLCGPLVSQTTHHFCPPFGSKQT